MPAISVRNLRKSYGSLLALEDISFEVEEGEIFGIIGPNGSGKTTTVECLQGLREPDSGEMNVLGLDPRSERGDLRSLIGSQLQESALPDRIRVWEALDLFAALSPKAVDWRVLLSQWGLAEKRNTAFANLSGGQRQRLFVALALVSSPRVVFLDEMTTGLDPAARRLAWDLVKGIREQGTTVVLVTHFMDEAESLCDRLAVFKRGRVLAIDAPAQLVARHSPEVVVRFSVDGESDLGWLSTAKCVSSFVREGAEVKVTGTGPVLAYTASALIDHGIAPEDLRAERATLEETYLRLTEDGAP